MSLHKNVSRRKFIVAAGASAVGSVLLKSCATSPTTTTTASPVAGSGGLETTKINLGYIAIFEAAPLIIAQEKGFFQKHGMAEAKVVKQASWGAARDNVEIGSAGGGIDGGQWQMPMPHLISEGVITKGNKKLPMYVLLQTSTQGNGIAIANGRADGTSHLGKGIGLDVSKAKAHFDQLKAGGNPFTAAYTFPSANQELWIRYWLAAGGIDPDTDVKLIVVPAAQTVANMQSGTMDGFSTGDPWPFRILADNIGFMAALTSQMWPEHPEEYLAIRADWVDKNPKATKAILKAIMEAQQWCDDPANRAELAKILSGRDFINVPEPILNPPLAGNYKMGDGKAEINDRTKGPLFWKGSRGNISYPFKSHDAWFLAENVRWGKLPGTTDIKAIVDRVNREDLWREAAKELNIPDADIPKETTRGVETFFDGIKFDAKDTSAYLGSLKIKKVK